MRAVFILYIAYSGCATLPCGYENPVFSFASLTFLGLRFKPFFFNYRFRCVTSILNSSFKIAESSNLYSAVSLIFFCFIFNFNKIKVNFISYKYLLYANSVWIGWISYFFYENSTICYFFCLKYRRTFKCESSLYLFVQLFDIQFFISSLKAKSRGIYEMMFSYCFIILIFIYSFFVLFLFMLYICQCIMWSRFRYFETFFIEKEHIMTFLKMQKRAFRLARASLISGDVLDTSRYCDSIKWLFTIKVGEGNTS